MQLSLSATPGYKSEPRRISMQIPKVREPRQRVCATTDQYTEFVVNGTGIPDVPFDVGESYAGLLPISSAPDETRELFFW